MLAMPEQHSFPLDGSINIAGTAKPPVADRIVDTVDSHAILRRARGLYGVSARPG